MPKLQSLVHELCRRLELEPPLPDEQGGFEVEFEPDATVQCFKRFEWLHLVSPLAVPPGPAMRRREWLKRLMNYSLYRMKGSHSTPALSEDGRVVLFARSRMKGMSVEDLGARIEEHLNSLESYRRLLGAVEPATSLERLPRFIVRP